MATFIVTGYRAEYATIETALDAANEQSRGLWMETSVVEKDGMPVVTISRDGEAEGVPEGDAYLSLILDDSDPDADDVYAWAQANAAVIQ